MRRRLAALAVLLTACVPQQMQHQAKYQPYGEAALFKDGAAMRPRIPGTIARGEHHAYYIDRTATAPAAAGALAGPVVYDAAPPPKLTRALLDKGRERYGVFCAPCHGGLGYGDGTIVKHGFPAPPSYHTARLRNAPDGHFYAVITRGYGQMYSYAARVSPEERWAIIAYVRALQLSQDAAQADVPATAVVEGGAR